MLNEKKEKRKMILLTPKLNLCHRSHQPFKFPPTFLQRESNFLLHDFLHNFDWIKISRNIHGSVQWSDLANEEKFGNWWTFPETQQETPRDRPLRNNVTRNNVNSREKKNRSGIGRFVMRGASFPSRRLREKRRNDGERRREQLRLTWPCHRTCPPFVQPSNLWSLYHAIASNIDSSLFSFSPLSSVFSNTIPCISYNSSYILRILTIPKSSKILPSLSKFPPPSLRADRPSFPSIRFPHFRFAMHGASFPSPLRSPLCWTGAQDTRGEGARWKRRKATAGNATKCEVWAYEHEGRNGTCWTSRCHWPEPARKRDEKEEKGD